jgi:hypothetical protein
MLRRLRRRPEIDFGEEKEAGRRNRAGSSAAKIGLETAGC